MGATLVWRPSSITITSIGVVRFLGTDPNTSIEVGQYEYGTGTFSNTDAFTLEFLAAAPLNVLGDLEVHGDFIVDGESLDTNPAELGGTDQVQQGTDRVSVWTGTKADYDTIVTNGDLDANRLYNIIDDSAAEPGDRINFANLANNTIPAVNTAGDAFTDSSITQAINASLETTTTIGGHDLIISTASLINSTNEITPPQAVDTTGSDTARFLLQNASATPTNAIHRSTAIDNWIPVSGTVPQEWDRIADATSIANNTLPIANADSTLFVDSSISQDVNGNLLLDDSNITTTGTISSPSLPASGTTIADWDNILRIVDGTGLNPDVVTFTGNALGARLVIQDSTGTGDALTLFSGNNSASGMTTDSFALSASTDITLASGGIATGATDTDPLNLIIGTNGRVHTAALDSGTDHSALAANTVPLNNAGQTAFVDSVITQSTATQVDIHDFNVDSVSGDEGNHTEVKVGNNITLETLNDSVTATTVEATNLRTAATAVNPNTLGSPKGLTVVHGNSIIPVNGGTAGQALVYNSNANGFEWTDLPQSGTVPSSWDDKQNTLPSTSEGELFDTPTTNFNTDASWYWGLHLGSQTTHLDGEVGLVVTSGFQEFSEGDPFPSPGGTTIQFWSGTPTGGTDYFVDGGTFPTGPETTGDFYAFYVDANNWIMLEIGAQQFHNQITRRLATVVASRGNIPAYQTAVQVGRVTSTWGQSLGNSLAVDTDLNVTGTISGLLNNVNPDGANFQIWAGTQDQFDAQTEITDGSVIYIIRPTP